MLNAKPKPTVSNWMLYLSERAKSSAAMNVVATLIALAATVSAGLNYAVNEKGMDMNPRAAEILSKATFPLILSALWFNKYARLSLQALTAGTQKAIYNPASNRIAIGIVSDVLFYILPVLSAPSSIALTIMRENGMNIPVQAIWLTFAYSTINNPACWKRIIENNFKRMMFEGMKLLSLLLAGAAAFMQAISLIDDRETSLANSAIPVLLAAYVCDSAARTMYASFNLAAIGLMLASMIRFSHLAHSEALVYFAGGVLVNTVSDCARDLSGRYTHSRPASILCCSRERQDVENVGLLSHISVPLSNAESTAQAAQGLELQPTPV